MPEMRFRIKWPDGSEESCYSPSLVIKDYLVPGEVYALNDFVASARTALSIASDRVKTKYGFPCSRALDQLQSLEATAQKFHSLNNPQVTVLAFLE
jgi:uncharacterized repeat protein (TIGR04042 family)